MAKSKLLSALAAEKGVDIKKVLQKRKQKENSRKARRAGLPDTRHLKKPQQQEQQKKKTKAVPEEDVQSDNDDEDWEEEEDSDDDEANGLIDDEAEEGDSDEEDEEEESDEEGKIDLAQFEHDESSSDSEVEMEAKIERPKKGKQPTDLPKPKADKSQIKKAAMQEAESGSDEDEEDEEDAEESDIDMEDLEDELDDEDREDLVPHTRTTINNHTALLAALARISLPQDASVPFATHQSVVSSKPTADAIEDVQDDLARELAFYAQALEAAKIGRAKLVKEGVPFTRPNDYFAEMVKTDGQMEKVKARLVEEATAKKAAAEARKQRDLKKFGKQVQVAKEQERAKAKRETLEKIKTLKRKRAESGAAAGEREAIDFDVAVEDEIKGADRKAGGKRAGSGGRDGGPSAKRQKKDSKFGFGGKKRHAKSNDAVSAGDLGGFSVKRMKAAGGGGAGGKGKKAPRLGKSKRKAAAGRR